MHSVKKMWTVATAQYREWICDGRHALLLILIVFVHANIVMPMVEVSEAQQMSMNALEPYVALANSMLLQAVVPFVYLILLSDFPSRFGNSVFYIVRTGRGGWLGGQLLFALFCAFTYAVLLLAVTTVLAVGHSHVGLEWSTVVTGIWDESTGMLVTEGTTLIDESTYYQGRLITVVLYSVGFMTLNLFLMNIIQIIMYCVGLQKVGLFVCISLEMLGAILCDRTVYAKWFFPTANSVFGEHFTKYFREPIFEVVDSGLYYVLLEALLISIAYAAIQNARLADGVPE